MKKMIAVVAILATLMSCGSSSTEKAVTTDSTAVAVDTSAVTATDTTVAQIPTEEAPKAETEVK